MAIRERLSDRFARVDGEVQTNVDLGLRIWKAGWVHALAGSNPASSATPTRGNASHPDSCPLPSVDPGRSFGLSWFGLGLFRYPDEAAYPGSNVSPNGIGHVLIAGSH